MTGEAVLAPERASTLFRGHRYLLKAPIDFTAVQWLEFNRDYEAFAAATEPAEATAWSMLLMCQIFHRGDQAAGRQSWWRRLLRRPAPVGSGPSAREIMSSTFGERLRALQDFTRASRGCGLGRAPRPTTGARETENRSAR